MLLPLLLLTSSSVCALCVALCHLKKDKLVSLHGNRRYCTCVFIALLVYVSYIQECYYTLSSLQVDHFTS